MTEQEALKKFGECCRNNDSKGAKEALGSISAETVNRQDDDDYDLLIQAAVGEDVCAVQALLEDGRCDLTHQENLCGLHAYDYALHLPEESPIRRAFQRKIEELREKYPDDPSPFKLLNACRKNDAQAVWAHVVSMSPSKLNENQVYSMPPGFLQELPLAVAVKAAAVDCVKVLLEYGADPDTVCRKNEKTPRELAQAGGSREILAVFEE